MGMGRLMVSTRKENALRQVDLACHFGPHLHSVAHLFLLRPNLVLRGFPLDEDSSYTHFESFRGQSFRLSHEAGDNVHEVTPDASAVGWL